MNNTIRQLLIDCARIGEPISYGDIMKKIGLNHTNPAHRNELSQVLYEISKFESDNDRPLLSSLAMYAGFKDHGPGFYELAELLGFGSKNDLIAKLFAFEQIKECQSFWQIDENYKNYYDIGKDRDTKHSIDFYTADEVNFLSNWAGMVYDKNKDDHLAAKNYIINTLGAKTVYWSNELVNILSGFDSTNRRIWSIRGWEDTPSGKTRVSRFKPYTWARIFRIGDSDKDIFFTIGVDGGSKELVYKLDYFYESNSKLNKEQKEVIEKHIPQDLRWKSISFEQIEHYNWDLLLEESSSFIVDNISVYDNLVALAWGDKTVERVFTNFLQKQPAPKEGLSELPQIMPKFQGTTKDFIREAIQKKEIGEAGESLVIQYEKSNLSSFGLSDFAGRVKKVKDGMGYDILSFNKDGSTKYIEVKTTTRDATVPFDLSLNEYLFAQDNEENYYIYRLYNYYDECNTADFYIIHKPLDRLLFQPTSFRAYNKKLDNGGA